MVTQPQENSLKEALRSEWGKLPDFNVRPSYSSDGDCLSVFFSPSLCYAKRMDGLLTVYLEEGTDELVGCKVKGVSQLIENIQTTIHIKQDGEVQFSLILLAAAGSSREKNFMYEISQKTQGMTIRIEDLKIAA